MQHRFRPAARACSGAVVLAFLSACGGGGGGGSSSPVSPATGAPVTSTPAPGTLSVPGQQSSGGGAGGFVNDGNTLSPYTVTSNPTGQSFSLAGQTYKTPVEVAPAISSGPLSIAFVSGYDVPITQVLDGAHTVFYNAASDSKGTVRVSSLQSIRRHPAGNALRIVAVTHHPLARRRTAFNSIDPTRVAVRMSVSALHTSGRTPADVERAAGSVGREALSATTDRLRVVSVPAGVSVSTFTRNLQAQPEIAEVTAVHRRRLQLRARTVVTDPSFDTVLQWYTTATGVPYAWSYNPGTGAKLAILDSGIDENNTDLTGQLFFQESAITPIDSSCFPISGATTQVSTIPASVQDDLGHGSNVAGIALAKADTAGTFGAAWGAQLLAFKIFPSQNANCNDTLGNLGAESPDIAQAIGDAVTQGADVISLSIGGPDYDTTEFNAIESAIAKGVTVVAAAGNDYPATSGTLDFPGAYPGVISVGASALKDEYYHQATQVDGKYATSTEIVASYSQYAPSLSVVAPGGDVCTSCDDGDALHWIANYDTSTNFDPSFQCSKPSPATSCLAYFEGTSQATPQVSATAAMLIAEAGHGNLTPAQVKYIIESTADNINDPHQGHGRLNAYRALASLVHDTAAYSGPAVQKAGTAQLIAFAYSTGRTNKPKILDASFPAGVPVNTDGTFRIADVPAGTGAFHVAVWYDANADGVIDAGDQVGVNASACVSTTACTIGSISLHLVAAGYYLP
jgi:hypothetical protein